MEENNRIIAEFMGAKLTKDLKIMYPVYEGDSSYVKNLKYRSDWNWLMEVVEKIESLGYRVTIVRHICRIDLTEESKLIISEDIKKIEAVYSACLKFIEWYNEQKKE